MRKIVLVSDNHYNHSVLKYILAKENDGDLYVHCGDSEMEMKSLVPFLAVKGNNDYDYNLPPQRFLEVEGKRIMVIHGNPYVSTFTDRGLVDLAKKNNADVVFFGHTHMFANYEREGIRFINPGSCNYNRDGSMPSYARVFIAEGIEVQRINIDPRDYL